MNLQNANINNAIVNSAGVEAQRRHNSILSGTFEVVGEVGIELGRSATNESAEPAVDMAGVAATGLLSETMAEATGTVAAEVVCATVAEGAASSIGEVIGEAIGAVIGGICDAL
ncbi:MAG: hypothetical protein FWD05_09345 [Oscillospiraceae bacterium]|nr:hypothetical protein [Oscillospiraceae bacterium]